ncbi:MAG: T9SS type A sorting domain-containing protein, partial [Saprospiraceae bacterium]
GDTTQTITGLSPGNYTVTLTDTNNCTTVETVTVSSFDCSGFGVSLTAVNPTCNGDTDGEATATPAGGAMPFNYNWSTGSNSATVSNLAAGTYTVTVTDSSNCEVTANITLTEPPLLSVSITEKTDVDCHGTTTGSATAAAGGGTPGYTYEWSNGGAGTSQNNLAAGTYTLTVTDDHGCTAVTEVTITEPPALSTTVSSTDETAVGAEDGTATAEATGGTPGYLFAWSNGDTTAAITGLAPGAYCVTVTDANGCTFNDCANVNAFGCGATSLSLSSESVSCFGGNDGTADAAATGFTAPVNYEWSNGGQGSGIENLEAGIYTVSVSDGNGCSATGQIEVAEPALLEVEITMQTNATCEGQANGAATVTGIGGTPPYLYSWPGGGEEASQDSLAGGIYDVTVTDANACTTSLAVTIGVDPDTTPPVAIAENLTIALDENGMGTITPSMAGNGSFDNCALDSMALDVSAFDCGDVGENTIVLTVWDPAGNSTPDTAIITVVDDIPPAIFCPENMTLTGCDGIVVEYPAPTASDNCSVEDVSLFSGLPPGAMFPEGVAEITWGATDPSGNETVCTFTVSVMSDLELSLSFTEPTCAGFTDGTATALPTGGVQPFSYAWNDDAQQTTATATGLAAGTYSVTITDETGCEAVATIDLPEPLPVVIVVDEVAPEMGSNMGGAVSITVAGGTGLLSTEWFLNGSPFSSDEDLTGLVAGTYTLFVTDENGCTAGDTVIVESVTGVANADFKDRISVFPNPVSGKLHVVFDLGVSAEVKVSLFDLNRRLVLPVLREKLQSKNLELDVTNQPPGIYILKMVVNETVMVKKVVVGR